MVERGEIFNEARFKQPVRFEDMVYQGNAQLTDIDAFMEYHDKLYIIVEVKHRGVEMIKAQREAFERLVDALSLSTKKHAVLLFCEHDVDPPDEVFLRYIPVTKYYANKKWHTPKDFTTADMAITQLIEKYGG